jgi:hypothetical protein
VKNGQSGKLGVEAELKVQNTAAAPGTNGLLPETQRNFDFALTAE